MDRADWLWAANEEEANGTLKPRKEAFIGIGIVMTLATLTY